MTAIIQRIKNLFGGTDPALSYNQVKERASDNSPKVRKELAQRHDVEPEILYYLTNDPDPVVRREIAKNEATPRQADAVLVKDEDEEVRSYLAEKIARLTPSLNSMEREDIRHLTVEILEQLARDQLPKIRQILAETLQDVADAPTSVIRQLAQDDELGVSVPILENSPVLTDEDLLQIIDTLPQSDALSAISKRKVVSASVADAIVSTDSKEAITDLLKNSSAQIREETLDLIIGKARDISVWHEPLVHRPGISASVAVRLAEFVADNYLNILEKRRDLDAATIKRVKSEVHRRIDEAGMTDTKAAGEIESPVQAQSETTIAAMAAAKLLHRDGKLGAIDIESALKTGDRQFARSALAVLGNVQIEVVEKIIDAQSPKGVMAICWKAGLPMRLATNVQSDLAGISFKNLINPRNGTDYPMSDKELLSALAFFVD